MEKWRHRREPINMARSNFNMYGEAVMVWSREKWELAFVNSPKRESGNLHLEVCNGAIYVNSLKNRHKLK